MFVVGVERGSLVSNARLRKDGEIISQDKQSGSNGKSESAESSSQELVGRLVPGGENPHVKRKTDKKKKAGKKTENAESLKLSGDNHQSSVISSPPSPVPTSPVRRLMNECMMSDSGFELGELLDEGGTSSTTHLTFQTGNPRVEIIRGTLHLYRDVTKTDCRSDLLCIVAVPAYMSVTSLCQFISPHIDHIQHIRILCHESLSSGTFMAVIKFVAQQGADDFYEAYYGKPFSSLSSEICKILYVESCKLDDGTDALSTDELMELPSCAVCLERLDRSCSGLLTILCNHTFHCRCLSAWKDSPCPVCRYMQEPQHSSSCMNCGGRNDLWMCLICGYVGCGRYTLGHAREHFDSTSHTYAIDLDSQRVWDYAGDGWVHRLLQNRADGKLVAVDDPTDEPEPSSHGVTEEDSQMMETMVESKIESIAHEYTMLLTSQLEQQRLYYEDQHARLETSFRDKLGVLENELEQSQSELVTAKTALAHSEKERKTLTRKIDSMKGQMKQLQDESEFLKSINESMKANQEQWRKQLEEVKAENKKKITERDAVVNKRVAELEEQVRDLMFSLDTQKTIQKSSHKDEIAEGVVIVPEAQSPRDKKKKTKI